MRIARFSAGSDVGFGIVEGDAADPSGMTVTAMSGHPFAPFQLSGEPRALSDVRLLAPVLPSKLVGVGRNYAQHAAELGNDVPEIPLIFLKPSTTVIGAGDVIQYPPQSQEVHHEAELAVVIARLCRDVPEDRVADVVLGFTCANDVTARDLQRADGFGRSKSFDSFCPLGPWVETDLDPADVAVRCTVNGQIRQDGRTKEMVHGVQQLVAFVSSIMTLLPGDVLLTGTPSGVSPLNVGDDVAVSVEGIGTLTNRVVARV